MSVRATRCRYGIASTYPFKRRQVRLVHDLECEVVLPVVVALVRVVGDEVIQWDAVVVHLTEANVWAVAHHVYRAGVLQIRVQYLSRSINRIKVIFYGSKAV